MKFLKRKNLERFLKAEILPSLAMFSDQSLKNTKMSASTEIHGQKTITTISVYYWFLKKS